MVVAIIRRLFLATVATTIMAAVQPRIHLQLDRFKQPNPPIETQSWMISGYDLAQNQELTAVEGHLTATDAQLAETNKNLVLLEREISDMQGANRIWFWLLAGLITAIGVSFFRSGVLTGKGEK